MAQAQGGFEFQLSGVPQVNGDVEIEIVHEQTGRRQVARPFRDGSATLRALTSGDYRMVVKHPNVVGGVVVDRRIHLYPGQNTRIPIPLPPALFTPHALADTPLADLKPVQDLATRSLEAAQGAGGKEHGDPIRAEDWNRMADALADLSTAILQLTQLVSPDGHDHPEIKDYVDETRTAMNGFIDSFGRRLAELQRQIMTSAVRDDAEDALAGATGVTSAQRERVGQRFQEMEDARYLDPREYARRKKRALVEVRQVLDEVRDSQPNPDAFAEQPSYQAFVQVAATEERREVAGTYRSEIEGFGAAEIARGKPFLKGRGS